MIRVSEGAELSVLSLDGEVIARHRLAVGSNQRIVVTEHYQGLHMGTGSRGRPGAVQVPVADLSAVPWPDAPVVEARPLAAYQDLLEMSP
jgi:hypothetical protein